MKTRAVRNAPDVEPQPLATAPKRRRHPLTEWQRRVGNRNVSRQIARTLGDGEPRRAGPSSGLPHALRAGLESLSGLDLAGVRVHKNSSWPERLKMSAFARGQEIHLGAGQDKHLPHEGWHVVQQMQGRVTRPQRNGLAVNSNPALEREANVMGERAASSIASAEPSSLRRSRQADQGVLQGAPTPVANLSSPRFAVHDAFVAVLGGTRTLQDGSTGIEVRILQQALLDAGQALPKFGVDGIFKGETKAAVEAFQRAQGLVGPEVNGVVDRVTISLLDTHFADRGAIAAVPQGMAPSQVPTEGVEYPVGSTPPELLEGTRTLTTEEKNMVEHLRTTEVKAPPGGSPPTFQDVVGGISYYDEVKAATESTIDRLYAMYAKGKAADHADPAKLHKMSHIEAIAVHSKRSVDSIFGNYAKGKPLKAGVNLKDAWTVKERFFATAGAADKKEAVEWRVTKIFGSPNVRAIDRKHGAVQSRSAEKAILDKLRADIIARRESELVEIHKGWPGFADPGGIVNLQLFKQPTAAANRDFLWQQFHTIVHEYIHTLEHSAHVTYRLGLGEHKGGKTYREGMDEYFTKIALDKVNYSAILRTAVEGPYHDPNTLHPIPAYGGYAEIRNAEAVVGVVGIRNAMAAFFLGRVEFLGG